MTVYPHERTVTCDQHRICTYCGEKIPCGSKYMYWSFIDEYGERSKNAMHLECEEKFKNSGDEHYDYYVNKRPIAVNARFDNKCVISCMFDFIRGLK